MSASRPGLVDLDFRIPVPFGGRVVISPCIPLRPKDTVRGYLPSRTRRQPFGDYVLNQEPSRQDPLGASLVLS